MPLYTQLGFKSNPFSKFSAEEESDYLDEIYLKPRYFDTLLSDIESGSSRLIFGVRGVGKSSLIIQLNKELEKVGHFTVIIDDYKEIPLQNNSGYFILRVVKEIIKKIIVYISKNPFFLKKLTLIERKKLAFFVKEFLYSISTEEYKNYVESIARVKHKNKFIRLYNSLFHKPINLAANAGIEILSDAISKSFGFEKMNIDNEYKNYFPEIKEQSITKEYVDEQIAQNPKKSKQFLDEVLLIVKKLGFNRTAIFFDRVDEFEELDSKIDKVSKFISPVLRDTTLLYDPNISLVFSLWNQVRDELNSAGVRYDKFKPIDISWSVNEIEQIVQKRLNYFSIEEQIQFRDLVRKGKEVFYLIDLANRSPRDVIRLLSHIYDEQSMRDESVANFSSQNISRGKLKFAKNYDYNSLFPSRKGSKEDIHLNINRILNLRKKNFLIKDLIRELKVSQQTAISYLKIMKNYGLVIELDERDGLAKKYEVSDPKIKYIIRRGFKSLDEIYY